MAVIPSSLADYLQRISAIPPLSAAEEVQIVQRIHAWRQRNQPCPIQDRRVQRALQRLICGHLHLVVCLAQRQQRHSPPQASIELLDLVQAGNLGLICAARRYDPRHGYRFASYACWWIKQAIQRHRHDLSSLIRVPESFLKLVARARNALARCPALPVREFLARELGTSPQRLLQILAVQRCLQPLSLDQPISGDPAAMWPIEALEDQRCNQIEETYQWLHDQLLQLAPGEQQVLQLRYLAEGPASIARIAAHTGRSCSQISRWEQRALRRLRRRLPSPSG